MKVAGTCHETQRESADFLESARKSLPCAALSPRAPVHACPLTTTIDQARMSVANSAISGTHMPTTARRMLYFPAQGSAPRLIDAPCRNDGAEDINSFARNLAPDLASLFIHPHQPSKVKVQSIALRSPTSPTGRPDHLHLFYSVAPSLVPNAFALSVIGLHHPENRIFWRGDMIVARWTSRAAGYGHIDVPEMDRIIAAVERILQQSFTERKLEQYLEEDRSWLSTTTLQLPRHNILRNEIRELDAYRAHRVLLLPADGTDPRHIPLVCSAEGAAVFHSYLTRAPDLWQIYGPAIEKTRMQILVVPPVPGVVAYHAVEYHVYYNLSPTLEVNEYAVRLTGDGHHAGRLIWRGDIVVARYEGASGYADVGMEALPVIEAAITSMWQTQALEAAVQSDRDILNDFPGSQLPRHVMLREHLAERKCLLLNQFSN